jgi:hypothetical protein
MNAAAHWTATSLSPPCGDLPPGACASSAGTHARPVPYMAQARPPGSAASVLSAGWPFLPSAPELRCARSRNECRATPSARSQTGAGRRSRRGASREGLFGRGFKQLCELFWREDPDCGDRLYFLDLFNRVVLTPFALNGVIEQNRDPKAKGVSIEGLKASQPAVDLATGDVGYGSVAKAFSKPIQPNSADPSGTAAAGYLVPLRSEAL